MTEAQTLAITWQGETYEFKPSFELFQKIEEKVSFNRLTSTFAGGNTIDLPMSHVAWVLYCCLRAADCKVRTPLEVQHALFDKGAIAYPNVIAGLFVAYYGAGPEKAPKKKPPATPRPRKLGPKSPSDTA